MTIHQTTEPLTGEKLDAFLAGWRWMRRAGHEEMLRVMGHDDPYAGEFFAGIIGCCVVALMQSVNTKKEMEILGNVTFNEVFSWRQARGLDS